LLRRWVAEGAEWSDHWAFVAPVKPEVPGVPEGWQKRVKNAVDGFVLAGVAKAGMEPADEASKEVLLRRVTFDLTGLPPTPEEVDAFLADREVGSFERVVDRLLAGEGFGERMGLAWLDIARYGDSSVMHADGPRYMWPWRDWVINAYNANMPFDQFTVEQLAGDLIEGATVQQKIASGFNRNHATSDEGGAIPEELRVDYVVDRVQTTANAWMGLSMECAQCHDHKYDPVSQREYYQMFAYFNQTKDPGIQTRNGNQDPVVRFFPSEDDKRKHEELVAKLEAAKQAVDVRRESAKGPFAEWAAAMAKKGAGAIDEPGGLVHRFVVEAEGEGEDVGIVVKDVVSGELGMFEGDVGRVEREGKAGLAMRKKGSVVFKEGEFGQMKADGAFTLAAWVKLPKSGGEGSVLAKMDSGMAFRGFDLWLQAGQVGTHIVHEWPDKALKVVSKEKLKAEVWQHVVVGYDGSGKANGVAIYIDGKKAGNAVEKDGLKKEQTIATAVPLRLGRRDNGAEFTGDVADVRIYGRVLESGERERIGANVIGKLLVKGEETRSDEEKKRLFDYFLQEQDGGYPKLVAERGKLDGEVAGVLKKQTSVMIMSQQEKPRPTYILDRGAYDAPKKDEEIEPGVPAFLPALPGGEANNRLGLAKWLVAKEHPLTARVAVNRYWGMLFGEGLVKTVADFGSQGAVPSHPDLLDWLAVDFVESGWDIKRMFKQLVMSATYRQSSGITKEGGEQDPENRLLARGPRFRLQGEFVRDNALAVSGLLVSRVGGASAKPYQPAGLWNEVSLGGNVRFVQDKGDGLYRKSMYIYWKRSAPHPGMMTFDAPTREKCVVQRARTNTPLQALVTLNDVQYVEAARALAQRVLLQGGDGLAERIRYAYKLVLGREPEMEEVALVAAALGQQRAYFAADASKAEALLKIGESPRDAGLDVIEHAAWTNVGSLLLNLDEVITRG
ncbi:MAG: DUF1553 domain-containing protein, partial [Verrucomicrobiales bacterium]|nr:DUF1553 domain-containing protein [Verrucomicrobiales bacterium]